MKIIIYTHTDYIDIYNIFNDYIAKIDIDKNDIFIFTNDLNPIYTYNTILYDDTKTYPQKIIECFSKININKDENILFIHDNDVIIKYDKNIINKISEKMYDYNIDRIQLYSNCNEIEYNYEKIHIDIDNNFYFINHPLCLPYSVGPSIWKLKSFLNILNKFNHKSYRIIEEIETQHYMINNFRAYYICNDNIGTYSNRTFFKGFIFLHLTINGCFVIDKKSIFCEIGENIYKDYKILKKIYLISN
jgi:hypothetical protein